MKKLSLLLLVIILLSSCDFEGNQAADKEMSRKTEVAMQEANRQTGYPAITNFQEKKLMKQIYELRDQENLICHAYLYNRNTGEIGQYLGQCVGYGLPYSTQFSNPEKIIDLHSGGNSYSGSSPSTIPQPEPNGLFMPDGMAATWLLLIDPKTGKPRPVYVEPEIIVSPFKLHK